MSAPRFAVGRLDHVHVHVRDRKAAVAWYRRVLGLAKAYDYTAAGDARGPVVLTAADGATHLALFEVPEAAIGRAEDRRTVAFSVDGRAFLDFRRRLSRLKLAGRDGQPVTAAATVDHGNSFSIYFVDPDSNPYEITTYDHKAVKRAVGAKEARRR
ncbi:MAG TPA: VOC family protein [Dongiaceae bacterium]|jgi:catechol 2,3-dioxygenase-like lactoylglutathione lyase family enzyme|nr:VOC family protein [Dongiaceae bacterium]